MLTLILAMCTLGGDDCCASMKEFSKDPTFQAAHLAPLPLNFKPQQGKMATLDYGRGSSPIFVVPPAEGVDVGIVMVHEWWGLNDYIKQQAERLHRETGYGVAAVDLYGGKIAATSEEAAKLVQGVDDETASAIMRAAPAKIKDGSVFGRKISKVGTIGWCFGGGWSFQAALMGGSNVDACVMYYGMPETEPDKLRALKAPVFAVFGNQDKRLDPELVGKFAQGMAAAARPLELRVYDADHAFANPSNPKYDKAHAEDAWNATLFFLRRYLSTK